MTEYAQCECATCGAIRYKNEMRLVSVRRIVGKSYGSGSSRRSGSSNSTSYGGNQPSRYRSGSSQSTRISSSSRTHMSRDRVWICKGCKAPKSDWSPAQRSFVIGAVGLVAFFGLQVAGGASNHEQAEHEQNQQVDTSLADSDASPNPAQDVDGSKTSSSPSAPLMPDVKDADETASGTDVPVAPQMPTQGAVDRAMQRAFERGESVRWEDGDLKGYAVPSEPEASSGCRSIYYSIDGRPGWQSATKTICP